MGTASTKKFIRNNAGTLTEEAALTTSAGAGDAHRIPALNAAGVLDATIINSTTTSAGAGSAGKVVALNASGFADDTIINASATSAANKVVKMNGAGIIGDDVINASATSAANKVVKMNGAGIIGDDVINATVTSAANKVVKLDGTGKLDVTILPTGIGADTAVVVASEALAAGDLVNVWNDAGTAKVRKADGSVSGKEANGFVLSAVASGANATVYFEGTNTQCTGLTPGAQFLSPTTAGKTTATAPTAAGQTVQRVGFALSATVLNFDGGDPIILA